MEQESTEVPKYDYSAWRITSEFKKMHFNNFKIRDNILYVPEAMKFKAIEVIMRVGSKTPLKPIGIKSLEEFDLPIIKEHPRYKRIVRSLALLMVFTLIVFTGLITYFIRSASSLNWTTPHTIALVILMAFAWKHFNSCNDQVYHTLKIVLFMGLGAVLGLILNAVSGFPLSYSTSTIIGGFSGAFVAYYTNRCMVAKALNLKSHIWQT